MWYTFRLEALVHQAECIDVVKYSDMCRPRIRNLQALQGY